VYSVEKELYKQLCKLRDEYGVQGIKSEFESEGASFRDLMRLRRITSKAEVDLFVKIGGVEALRDIKDALEIGVDGLIAPMVESKFGAKKFSDSLQKVYGSHHVHSTLNIETKTAVDQLESILKFSSERFQNITLGRTDLSSSFFDKDINPDCDFMFNLIEGIAPKVAEHNLTFTVGGSVSAHTLNRIESGFDILKDCVHKIETRKVILSMETVFDKKDAIKQALRFEELYILSKKEFSDVNIGMDIARLTELQRRI